MLFPSHNISTKKRESLWAYSGLPTLIDQETKGSTNLLRHTLFSRSRRYEIIHTPSLPCVGSFLHGHVLLIQQRLVPFLSLFRTPGKSEEGSAFRAKIVLRKVTIVESPSPPGVPTVTIA